MSATDHQRPRFTAARWVLLLAVIAGVIGMHVLTAGDGPGHGTLPMPFESADHPASHGAPAVGGAAADPFVTVSRAAPPPMSGHGDMVDCILFLVVGGALSMLLVLAARGLGADGVDVQALALRTLRDVRRRGPPTGRPRLALGVMRV